MSLMTFLRAVDLFSGLLRWLRWPRRRPLSILLVEDDINDAELTRRSLEQLGCRYDWQNTAEGALALLDKNGYDFCLIDLKLPMMSGIQLITTLLDSRPYVHLVAVTGSMPLAESLPAGKYMGLILKPVTKEALTRMIRYHRRK